MAKILAMMQREKSGSNWQRLNYSMAKSKGGSVRTVQTGEEDGAVRDHTTQSTVQEAIWDEIHGQRFYLAEQAPIYQVQLRGDFGYMAFLPMAHSMLEGTYAFPAHFNQATRELAL